MDSGKVKPVLLGAEPIEPSPYPPRPEGATYFDPTSKQWMAEEPAAKDDSFLPFGAEDWINPAGWSRGVVKKITSKIAARAAEKAIKTEATVAAKEAPTVVQSIIARLKGKVPEEKLDELALTALKQEPVHLATAKDGIQATFKPGTPLHKELVERGRALKEPQSLVYGTAQVSKKFDPDAMERARRMRAKQAMELFSSKNSEGKE